MKFRPYALLLLFSQVTIAQNCDFNQINDLFQKKQYALVYSLCHAYEDCEPSPAQSEWLAYHQAYSALELFNDEAEFRFESYLNDYPNGKYQKKAYLSLAKIHFRNKEFEKTIAKLSLVDTYDLDQQEFAMYYFRLGYSYFVLGNYEKAQLALYDIKEISFSYSELTTYCLAHIAYDQGHYATALLGFKDLENTPKLGVISKYYITHIYYYQKKYQELIEFATPLLENSINPKRDVELIRLIGGAYYALGNYNASVEYLERYISTGNELSRPEKYQLATSYYELNNYPQAVKQFESILLEKDSISQFGAHQLAQTYLKMDKPFLAINAFKYAANIDFDYSLKEDAAFNTIKLIYTQKNTYQNAEESIEKFIIDFPESVHLPYAQDLLIKSYTSTKNYRSAIDKLSKFEVLTFEQKQVYQKLSYHLALEYYLNEQYQESIDWFDKSLSQPLNSDLIASTYYWMGEAQYMLGNFSLAIQYLYDFQFKDGAFVMPEYLQSQYSLAYAYYHSKQYQNAVKWFRKYIRKATDNHKLTDAYLRLGDAYFMLREYQRAQEFYVLSEGIGAFDVDYAIHQQIICFGLTNQTNKRRTALNHLISDFPNSPYHDDAMLTLSTMYQNENRNQESEKLLTSFLEKHPNSPLYKKVLLNLGLNYYNNDNIESALSLFKKVIEEYPATNESKEALIAYKNLSIESGDVKSYFDYIGGLSNVSVDIATKDSISYEAAENLYLNQYYEKAAQAFSDYLKEFDEPIFKLNAHFYKAECLFTKSPVLALEDYRSVLEFPKNDYYERSLIRLSRIEFEQEEYGVAALHYSKLLEIAQDNNLKRESVLHLFKSYNFLGIQERSVNYAKMLLEFDKINLEVINQARLVIANYYFDLSEFHLAKKEYNFIAQNNKADFGSEAKYQLSYLLFLEDELDSCEQSIFNLSEEFYNDYYIAKGFILLADVYLKKGNTFQSKATLQSIVDNYKGQDLVELCLQKIEDIEEIDALEVKESKKEELIIDLLNDIELNEFFEEENNIENED